MNKKTLFSLMIIGSILVSGCGTQVVPQRPSKGVNSPAIQVPRSKTNIQVVPDAAAARVPKLFYQYVTARRFKEARKLLGPQLQFETDSSTIKYLKNITGVKFLEFRDISKDPGFIEWYYEKYYRIKVYYATIIVSVANPDLVPDLPGINYRKFILIKMSKNSPWLMDTDEDTTKR